VRVAKVVRGELVNLFLTGAIKNPEFPSDSITITQLKVSSDLRQATVYVMPLGGKSSESILAALKKYTPQIRHALIQRLRMPISVRFFLDDSFDAMDHINALFQAEEVQQDLHKTSDETTTHDQHSE
jgi:ribosome-binding factor A